VAWLAIWAWLAAFANVYFDTLRFGELTTETLGNFGRLAAYF